MTATERITNHDFIRVPADSAGKRSGTNTHVIITYKNGTIAFSTGQQVTGQTSGCVANIVRTRGTLTTGEIVVVLDATTTMFDFAAGENLLVGGVAQAQVDGTTVIHVQINTLVGQNDPYAGQFVDKQGAAYMRYPEGAQQMDNVGLTRASLPSQVIQHKYAYDSLNSFYSDTVIGSGSALTYQSGANTVVLTTGIASGSKVQRTTDRFFHIQQGSALTFQTAIAIGDAGTPGSVRRWGLYGDSEGIFFEVSGTTFSVGHRSSVVGGFGVIVEEKTKQSDFNGDTLDGNDSTKNSSLMLLDLTKVNNYWFDYAWNGTGKIRFGVYGGNGERIICHTHQETNEYTWPLFKLGSMPFRIEQYTEALLGAPTDLKCSSMTILLDGNPSPSLENVAGYNSYTQGFVSCSSVTSTPLFSFRSAASFLGQTNRQVSVPRAFMGFAKTAPVLFELYNSCSVTGTVFTATSASALAIGPSGTMVSGQLVSSWVSDATAFDIELLPEFSYLGKNLTTRANGSAGEIWTLAARSLEPGLSASVFSGIRWLDHR